MGNFGGVYNTKEAKIAREKLEPVDVARCQSEHKEPHQPFRLGFLRWERCKRRPVWVALEPKNNGRADRGAMSLCPACGVVFAERFDIENGNPDKAQLDRIEAYEAAHRIGGDDAVRKMIAEHE